MVLRPWFSSGVGLLATLGDGGGIDQDAAVVAARDRRQPQRALGGTAGADAQAVELAAVAGAGELLVAALPLDGAALVGALRIDRHQAGLLVVDQIEAPLLAVERRFARLGNLIRRDLDLVDL